MNLFLAFLLISSKIALITASDCLVRSGIDPEFWLLCYDIVQKVSDAKKNCESYQLNLAKTGMEPSNKNVSWYLWFNQTSSNQKDEMRRAINSSLNNIIIEQNKIFPNLKLNLNNKIDTFKLGVNNYINQTNNSLLTNDVRGNINTQIENYRNSLLGKISSQIVEMLPSNYDFSVNLDRFKEILDKKKGEYDKFKENVDFYYQNNWICLIDILKLNKLDVLAQKSESLRTSFENGDDMKNLGDNAKSKIDCLKSLVDKLKELKSSFK